MTEDLFFMINKGTCLIKETVIIMNTSQEMINKYNMLLKILKIYADKKQQLILFLKRQPYCS